MLFFVQQSEVNCVVYSLSIIFNTQAESGEKEFLLWFMIGEIFFSCLARFAIFQLQRFAVLFFSRHFTDFECQKRRKVRKSALKKCIRWNRSKIIIAQAVAKYKWLYMEKEEMRDHKLCFVARIVGSGDEVDGDERCKNWSIFFKLNERCKLFSKYWLIYKTWKAKIVSTSTSSSDLTNKNVWEAYKCSKNCRNVN